MSNVPLYPLRFEPIFQPRIWGGRRLGELLNRDLPGPEPFGEAWVLSDQGEHLSRVADGPLRGQSLRDLMAQFGEQLLGRCAGGERFPLLLKFLDARDTLSVQVHPDDRHTELLPPGQRGKTEAWVVLHAEPGSRIYAGLQPGLDAAQFRRALAEQTAPRHLASFEPRPGDCVFLQAGTVHALGGGLVIFEVQQNSDVTFRLYDWDRVDAKTGQPRQLHVDEALACTDFSAGAVDPVTPIPEENGLVRRERLVSCTHFQLWRHSCGRPFTIGAEGQCRIVVGAAGQAYLKHDGQECVVRSGDVVLLPADVGNCECRPQGRAILLECGLAG